MKRSTFFCLRRQALMVFAASMLAGALVGRVSALEYQITARYAHDARIFTQGLLWVAERDGPRLYQSGGGYGTSSLAKLRHPEGTPMQSISLPDDLFAEGVAKIDNKLYLLSWRKRHGLIFDTRSLKLIGRFDYKGEGWGLCANPEQSMLVMSNGSRWLSFREPVRFRELRRVAVSENGVPLSLLNELEWIGEHIFANILGQDRIVLINPKNGMVVDALELSALRDELKQKGVKARELNGIAWDQANRRLLVTGKYWPILFALKLDS